MPPIRRILVLAVEGALSVDIIGPGDVFAYAEPGRGPEQALVRARLQGRGVSPAAYRDRFRFAA